jgi:hypothetical protein
MLHEIIISINSHTRHIKLPERNKVLMVQDCGKKKRFLPYVFEIWRLYRTVGIIKLLPKLRYDNATLVGMSPLYIIQPSRTGIHFQFILFTWTRPLADQT